MRKRDSVCAPQFLRKPDRLPRQARDKNTRKLLTKTSKTSACACFRSHYYGSEIAANPVDARSGRVKMRRLGKEIKGLREAAALPCRPEAAAFLLCDTTRMDVFKFMLSGPTETPYSFGAECGPLSQRFKSIFLAFVPSLSW